MIVGPFGVGVGVRASVLKSEVDVCSEGRATVSVKTRRVSVMCPLRSAKPQKVTDGIYGTKCMQEQSGRANMPNAMRRERRIQW